MYEHQLECLYSDLFVTNIDTFTKLITLAYFVVVQNSYPL